MLICVFSLQDTVKVSDGFLNTSKRFRCFPFPHTIPCHISHPFIPSTQQNKPSQVNTHRTPYATPAVSTAFDIPGVNCSSCFFFAFALVNDQISLVLDLFLEHVCQCVSFFFFFFLRESLFSSLLIHLEI